jgi:hypothetical protein
MRSFPQRRRLLSDVEAERIDVIVVYKVDRLTRSGATKIMVIRHAEKPGTYSGTAYSGVDEFGTVSGAAGAKHLVTLGWERAGALITLFASPYGPAPNPPTTVAARPYAEPRAVVAHTVAEQPSQRHWFGW